MSYLAVETTQPIQANRSTTVTTYSSRKSSFPWWILLLLVAGYIIYESMEKGEHG